MRIDIVTIFPEYVEPLRHALLGKALEQGILSVGVHDLRDWAQDAHKSVDDTPCGGGPGMVMKPTVWGPALDDIALGAVAGKELDSAAPHRDTRTYVGEVDDAADLPLLLVPTPAGTPFTQADAQAWAKEPHIVFACGRYEGIDQRVIEDAAKRYRVREVSIGDYVLIGGEVAVLVIAEAVVRNKPAQNPKNPSHHHQTKTQPHNHPPTRRIVFPMACWRARATRSRGCGGTWRFPRCYFPATINGSTGGAATRPCCAPNRFAPSCWSGWF